MQLYLKKKEPEKALEVTQHRLYVLVRQMLMCLTTLMNGGMITDNEKVLEICGVYHRLEEIFGVGGGGLFCRGLQENGQAGGCAEKPD